MNVLHHLQQIYTNQDIKEIFEISEKVNEIALFIKKISNDRNMLDLYASIEVAKAGEFGR